ncbi:MAG: DUF2231 domain-containing protein [Candidatus Zixiibacteriota bacterium]
MAGALLITGAPALLLAMPSLATPINRYCPVLTDEPVDLSVTTTYEGREIAFCCKKCRRQFLENPERYLEALTATAQAEFEKIASEKPVQDPGQHDHTHHDHDDTATASDTVDSIVANSHAHSDDTATTESSGATAEHDHATDHGASGGNASGRFITFMGKFHPVIVHFPIALIIVALAFSVLAMLARANLYDLIAVKTTYLGGLSAVVSALLGLAAASGAHYPDMLVGYFTWHRLLGITSAALTLLSCFLAYRYEKTPSPSRQWLFRGTLALNAVLVGVTGHFGATLIYGPDHFAF